MIDLTLHPPFSDLTVHLAAVPKELDQATGRGVLWQAAPNRFLLDVPEIARYLVEGGEQITVDMYKGASEKDIQRILNMAPLAALAYQRGCLVMHAAVVTRNMKTVLLAGDSGCGKSTLAVEMARRGWLLYSDELAFLKLDDNQQVVVLPGAPEAALWPESLDQLGIQASNTDRFDDNRRRVIFPRVQRPVPLSISGLVSLSLHNHEEIAVQETVGTKRFMKVGFHLFQSHIAEVLLDKAAYFSIATAIARDTRFISIKRPRDLWSVDTLAERIAAELP